MYRMTSVNFDFLMATKAVPVSIENDMNDGMGIID